MLHVFLVDIGIMLKFEMEFAVESVSRLMEAVQQKVLIPANKQVLLSADGEPLNPTNRVASYASAGTETQPIYLFSKSTIESPVPPPHGVNLKSEASLKEEVEKSLQMKPKYETLVARAKLALEFQRIASDLGENCENLLNDQVLQKKGWTAVIKNLDHITSAFKTHLSRFELLFTNFQQAKLQYHNMLQSFHQVFLLLKQLPLIGSLSGMRPDTQITLLEWISSHDQQTSLDNLVSQCQEAVKQCKLTALEEIMMESRKVLEFVDNNNMKDIKGLTERLASLEHRVGIVQQLVQDQTDMAQGFQQNQMRAEHLGDPSVLPDLCASHQKQLIVLLKNQHQIRDIHNLCAKAKDELSTNLHARLRWVMYVERSIYEHDSKLLVYHKNLRRVKKRLDILEQVYEAPRMYICAVLEVMRRKNFSSQFAEWCSSVTQSSITARTEELAKRKTFQQVFNNHFVKTLFPGIDYEPPPFAEDPFDKSGDEMLPLITVQDVQMLQQTAPELMSEINLGDPLVESVVVRNTFSQKNLSKLVDPRQNKVFEETLNFREKTQFEHDQLTMSVLQREINCKANFDNDVQFEVDDIKETSKEGESFHDSFEEPSSLKSLPDEKRLNLSDDSDALFHSAELEFDEDGVGSYSPSKSPKSGKSSSSPIAIKGFRSRRSKQTTKNIANKGDEPKNENENEKEKSLSVPIVVKPTETSPTNQESLSKSDINCRSLSEAIKSSEVTRSIKDSGDIVKSSKNEIVLLRQIFSTIHSEFMTSLGDLSTDLDTLKNYTQTMKEQEPSICKNCRLLQERIVVGDSKMNDEMNELKEQYLDVISEKDRIAMEHNALLEKQHQVAGEITKLEGKIVQLTEDNEKLNESLNKHKEDMTELNTLKVEAESVKDELSVKNNELTTKINDLTTKYDEMLTKNNELSTKVDEVTIKNNDLVTKNDELSVANNEFLGELENVKVETTNFKQEMDENKKQIEKLTSENKQLSKELEEKNIEISTKTNELNNALLAKEQLMEESFTVNDSLQKSTLEVETLRNELEASRIKRQESTDLHLDQVSASSVQIKELIKQKKETETLMKEQELRINGLVKNVAEKDSLLSKKEQQFNELLQRKDCLEAQNQTNFNFVLNKIRKEKDIQINDLKESIKVLEKDVTLGKLKNDTLNEEINIHKAAYTEIQERLETEKDKCIQYEESLEKHGEVFTENERLKVELDELRNGIQKTLEKEKASILLDLELDKECALEEHGKSEMMIRRSKSTSIEEGIDELELERLMEKVKSLEAENTTLKNGLSAVGTSNENLLEIERVLRNLKNEKLAIRNIEAGHFVILCLDEIINQYTVLHLSPQRLFLHPDSLKVVRKLLEKSGSERRWMFAFVTEVEICVCKKANNKFNLPVNSYFTRIRVNPYELENV